MLGLAAEKVETVLGVDEGWRWKSGRRILESKGLAVEKWETVPGVNGRWQ